MEDSKLEILLKIMWIGLFLFTIYWFSWLTFGFLVFEFFFIEKYNIWNLFIPNILTIGLLVFYTKELLFGYEPKSESWNIKSLLIFSALIIILILVQIPQFELLFNDLKSESWQIALSLFIILTSYVGIIMNRVLRIKKLKNTN